MTEILTGHTSPESAYVVDDYPYGFRLRCKIRYWLEHKPGHGVRLVSQTTNPKKAGEVWNKPKASTYARFGGCMYLDDVGRVTWTGLSQYSNGAEAVAWEAVYMDGVPPSAQPEARAWVKAKLAYDLNREEGDPLAAGLPEARRAFYETLQDSKAELAGIRSLKGRI